MKSAYSYIQDAWNKPSPELDKIWKERLIKWRREPVSLRIEHPTRLDRARALGYKAKKGYFIVRIKLRRGGRQRPKFAGGRKSSKMRRMKIVDMNYQWVAEQRANKHYKNAEVLNSYFVAKDGKHYWYEIILVDRSLVGTYEGMEWLRDDANKGRVYRGLTSAARRSRGLLGKGKGYEKMRPSKKANKMRRLVKAKL
ncbi:MAG: 50S ribosomal protein L15e [Nanoarchaeota archaeon]